MDCVGCGSRLVPRDLPEMFLIRGIVFSHETVRDWETKLTSTLAECHTLFNPLAISHALVAVQGSRSYTSRQTDFLTDPD